MSLATGAAGAQLGPRALALAADLNKAKGLSMRKTCAILHDCFSLQLSAGGLSQALDRVATKVQGHYQAIAEELRQAPVVHSDETSWWVAGPGWWLWVFTTQLLTFYVVAATNNLAERQLRPAVIARKISCGNKTPKGARTWQILASLAATCAQRATSFIAELTRAAPLQPR